MIQTQLQVRSPAFAPDSTIPKRYTEDGENLSPPLEWSGVPEEAQELAVVVDDQDAPGNDPFAHWLMYHIPPQTSKLIEGVSERDSLAQPQGAVQGRNSFKTTGYRGPAPPKGKPHHYHFSVYALDSPVDVAPDADRKALLDSMQGHVLAKGEFTATYGRS